MDEINTETDTFGRYQTHDCKHIFGFKNRDEVCLIGEENSDADYYIGKADSAAIGNDDFVPFNKCPFCGASLLLEKPILEAKVEILAENLAKEQAYTAKRIRERDEQIHKLKSELKERAK